MKNLKIWNWHYKIFFDKDILDKVNSFIEKLNKDEQNIYLYIRDFFLSFYSISQLIDAIEECPDKYELLVGIANSNKDKLILTPSLVIDTLEKRIILLPKECQKDISQLIDYSRMSQYNPDFKSYCSVIFGNLYNKIIEIAFASEDSQKINHGRKLKNTELISFTDQELAGISTDRNVINKFGNFNIEKYDTEISNSIGYAEWWDRDLLDSETDKLILFDNSDSMFINDLKYTIIHEIFPGHGYFYNSLAHNSDYIFDHGAIALIEGWATFVEWNTIPSKYISQIRQNSCTFLAQSVSSNGDKLAQNILIRKQALGFSNEESLRTITYLTQYIGFLESYYAGAL